MLHKWRMLSDRRRKVIIGSILIAIILGGIIVYETTKSNKGDGGNNEPITTPSPTTETPVTTVAPPTTQQPIITTVKPDPGDKNSTVVASKDGLALVSIKANLHLLIEKEFIEVDPIEDVNLSSKNQTEEQQTMDKQFVLTIESTQNLQLEFKFDKTGEKIESNQLEIRWNFPKHKSCQLGKDDEKFIKMFNWPTKKHIKCNKSEVFSCRDEKGTEIASLSIKEIEIELDREKPAKKSDSGKYEFETPAFECS